MFEIAFESLRDMLAISGFANLTYQHMIMLTISCVMMYLAIAKKFEPLLLLPIAFGMFIANCPLAGLSSFDEGGLLYILYQGLKLGIYPPLIFLGVGAMTDFGPLIAYPKSFLIGIAGQVGIFVAFILAYLVGDFFPYVEPFSIKQAAAIGIIGSSDGPTSIFTAINLAPELIGSITIAAYSYMALVPVIQTPIMRALTTDKERVVVMPQLREVSRTERLVFPVIITALVLLTIPAAGPLIAMLMFGNLLRESGVTTRLAETAQNELMNILTIVLGLTVGATTKAEYFLTAQTLIILLMGLIAFSCGTISGVLFAKIMCRVTGGKVNPLIGNSGVSAMPMAARISQKLASEYKPGNFVLMHAMGPIVASTIGSAFVAGVFISILR